MTRPGKVSLVGAGPGDPGLLTVKGRECLEAAEVVLYDYLASPALLSLVPEGAELIYVGKKAGCHTLKQPEIIALLIKKAKEGRRIVRLKGGDPFVFGRGSEEAAGLRSEGIEFEIVPGVTSGVAAPAYAGIPVTDRTCTSVLTFVTGHEDPTKDASSIDWPSLASNRGTLVFYMGVKNLPVISKRLQEEGRAADTPAAVIRWGTMPTQTTVEGTLADIADKAREAGITAPAIIIVGDVVRLRRDLQWFEGRPLFGKRVLVTRSRTQASALTAQLQTLGALAIEFPTIRIEPPEDWQKLYEAIDRITDFDWIIFTSVNGVANFFDALTARGMDSRSLSGIRVCCIGSAAAECVMEQGINTDLLPARFTSEGVVEALAQSGEIDGRRFLLPRADIAPPDLLERLRENGGEPFEVVAYRTLPAEPPEEALTALRDGEVDVVTFSSSSTARNFAEIARREIGELPRNVVYASIGPETTKAARAEGMDISIEAQKHTIPGLVAALVDELGVEQP